MEWMGYALGILHVGFIVSLIATIIASHTIYRERWFKTFIFCIIVLIFVQHLVYGKCIITVYEKQLTKLEQAPFHSIVENFFSLFGWTLDDYYTHAESIECTVAICLGLELISLYLG
jgi:hypothetical protein